MSITEAFRKYGAILRNSQWAVSAIAEDGSLVMSCWQHYLSNPETGVMRYTDSLVRWNDNNSGKNLLGTHLSTAYQDKLPVRLVIASTTETSVVDKGHNLSRIPKKYHIRPELVGLVAKFDETEFVIDFRKAG